MAVVDDGNIGGKTKNWLFAIHRRCRLLAILWSITLPCDPCRNSPAIAAPIGVGAIGDSLTDEYDIFAPAIYGSEGKNWVEQLAIARASELSFGEFSSTSRGVPRYAGYAQNWARSGATSAGMLKEGQISGLVSQIASGSVSLVYIGIGTNDFAAVNAGDIDIPGFGSFGFRLSNVYGPIYNGQMSVSQVTARVEGLVANVTAAIDQVQSAGGHIVIGTAVDYGAVPSTRSQFLDAARRQRISDAVHSANSQITDIAISKGIPIVDVNALMNLYFANSPTLVGGVDVDVAGFHLADGLHPGTLVQGLLANGIIHGANAAYGYNLTPLSGEEILRNAGMPAAGGATFDARQLVIVPEPGAHLHVWSLIVAVVLVKRAFRLRTSPNPVRE